MQMSLFNEKVVNAKPFMKWVGGKRQLIPEIEMRLPKEILKTREINYYFEPFIGGGALFFYLMSNYKINNAYISDINKELILTYNVIKNDPNKLIELLSDLEYAFLKLNNDDRKKFYFKIRDKFNEGLEYHDFSKYDDKSIERASQTIFFNKTGFNGLFRVNKKGEFNVPCGRYKNPTICDKENILNVHEVLKDVQIETGDYSYSLKYINDSSFIYLDPPYRPITKTSSFTSYTDNEFNDEDQKELAGYFTEASNKGAYVMLSNSDPHNSNMHDDFFDNLYEDYNIERITAKRSINSKADKRGPISELIIRNYR